MTGKDEFKYDDPGIFERIALDVGDGHVVNVELSGYRYGRPIVHCHGGPGGSIGAYARRYANPETCLLVQFDQRGCGASTPAGRTTANTTHHLISDMEKIRDLLGLEAWTVSGGSWGSTLALAYAQAHPERTTGVIVRGSFLGDEAGYKWFDATMRQIYPDAFEEYAEVTGCAEHESVYDAAARLIYGPDLDAQRRAAAALTLYEERCATLSPQLEEEYVFDGDTCLPGIRVALHYRDNQAFLPPNGVLGSMGALKDTPGMIVHGRYDMICPVGNAIKLHRKWLNSKIVLCPRSGHLGTEPEIVAAMTIAFEETASW